MSKFFCSKTAKVIILVFFGRWDLFQPSPSYCYEHYWHFVLWFISFRHLSTPTSLWNIDGWISDVFSRDFHQNHIIRACGHVSSLQNMFGPKGKFFFFELFVNESRWFPKHLSLSLQIYITTQCGNWSVTRMPPHSRIDSCK